MKKTAYVLIALGVVLLVFAAVCLVVAGAMVSDVEAYAGYMLGGMPGIDTGDLIEMVRSLGFAIGSFDLFAYDYRFWILAGGIVLLAAGLIMFFVSAKRRPAARVGRRGVTECPVCGAVTAGDSAFCMNCGASIMEKPVIKPVSFDIGAVRCKSCGTDNEYGSRFCMNCGTELSARHEAEHVYAAAADEGTVRISAAAADEGTVRISAASADEGTVRIDMHDFEEGTVRVAANAYKAADSDAEGTVYIRLSDER